MENKAAERLPETHDRVLAEAFAFKIKPMWMALENTE